MCNWLGGEVVADMIAAPGFDAAGYVNISTSDKIVHGQVKQADLFSFVRIYEAGHEVPFYQPLASLEVFARALNQTDIATGKIQLGGGGYPTAYKTVGTKKSEFREGNSTVQMDVTPTNATYNTMLNAPDPTPTWAVSASEGTERRALRKKRAREWKRLAW